MLATLPSSAPVPAVLAGLWKDDLLGPTPGMQQLQQQVALPGLQVRQRRQSGPALGQQQQQPLEKVAANTQLQLNSPAGRDQAPQQQQSPNKQPQQQEVLSSMPAAPATTQRSTPPTSPPPEPARRAGYSSDSYWNDRYAEKSTHFDWFYNYSALASLIRTTCSTSGPCLHIGCGNSGLSDGMVQDGFQVVNVDISDVVIEQMRCMHAQPGQSWEVADCRSMPQYADASFGSVLDKGTLDAVLCSSHGQADTVSYVNEVHRLLMPGGTFLLISLGQPHARMVALNAAAPGTPKSPSGYPYLSEKYQHLASAAAAAKPATNYSWSWDSVEVYLLPKPSLYLASEMSLAGKKLTSTAPHTDKDMPVAWLGPFAAGEELDEAVASQGLELREYFTAFACKKKGAAGVAAVAADVAAAAAGSGDVCGSDTLPPAAPGSGVKGSAAGGSDLGVALDNANA